MGLSFVEEDEEEAREGQKVVLGRVRRIRGSLARTVVPSETGLTCSHFVPKSAVMALMALLAATSGSFQAAEQKDEESGRVTQGADGYCCQGGVDSRP